MAADGYIFVDIETTGLEPETEHILEVGFALYSLDLEPVDRWSTLVVHEQTAAILHAIDTDPSYEFIKNMHTSNGLLGELADDAAGGWQHTAGIDGYDQATVDVVRAWGADRTEPMCGSSLRLDRNFIDHHMPKLAEVFSYRSIDVSSRWQHLLKKDPAFVKEACAKADSYSVGNHRVLGDIHDSVNMMRVLDGMEPIPYA